MAIMQEGGQSVMPFPLFILLSFGTLAMNIPGYITDSCTYYFPPKFSNMSKLSLSSEAKAPMWGLSWMLGAPELAQTFSPIDEPFR